jgi:hypothetical protein
MLAIGDYAERAGTTVVEIFRYGVSGGGDINMRLRADRIAPGHNRLPGAALVGITIVFLHILIIVAAIHEMLPR